MRREIDSSLVKIRNGNYRIEEIKFSEVITQCPLFSSLLPQEMAILRIKSKEKNYPKGTVLLAKGSSITSAIIIISGSIREQFDDFYFMKSIGSVLNPFDFTFR